MIGPDAESRVAIRMTPGAGDLRTRGRTYWETLVARSGATILSACSSEACEAYLLSESSLFVWSDRLTLITCGQTCLVDAVEALLDEDGAAVASLRYQQRHDPRRDIERLSARLSQPIQSVRGGAELTVDLGAPPAPIMSLQMYGLSEAARARFTGPKQRKAVRVWLDAAGLVEGLVLDEHFFSPCGYSANGLQGDGYWTLHVSPEAEGSAASFETDLALPASVSEGLVAWMGASSVAGRRLS